MPVAWKRKYDPNELAERLDRCKQVGTSGEVSFTGFEIIDYFVLLYSMLDFPAVVPEVEGRTIAKKAATRAARDGAITPSSLLEHSNRLTQRYLRKPVARFVLVSTLSLARSVSLSRLRFGSTNLIFESAPPSRYQVGRNQVLESARSSLPTEPPSNYLFARVHVHARSANEAVETALNALDFVRGAWNWWRNRQSRMRMSGGQRRPANDIVVGPLHTLHDLSGQPATQTWWYEPGFCGAPAPRNLSAEDVGQMESFLRKTRDKLRKIAYPSVLRRAIVRYGRALDLTDWEAAFLKLWSTLELLTDSSRLSNDITAKRAAFLYQDRGLVLQVLEHLRQYRNRSVHSDTDNSAIETFMYQAKGFVEDLLSFHFANEFGFRSMAEAARFLSLPSDHDAIDKRLKLLYAAREFRT